VLIKQACCDILRLYSVSADAVRAQSSLLRYWCRGRR